MIERVPLSCLTWNSNGKVAATAITGLAKVKQTHV